MVKIGPVHLRLVVDQHKGHPEVEDENVDEKGRPGGGIDAQEVTQADADVKMVK